MTPLTPESGVALPKGDGHELRGFPQPSARARHWGRMIGEANDRRAHAIGVMPPSTRSSVPLT